MPRLRAPTKEESLLLPPYAGLPDAAIVVPQDDAGFAQARRLLLGCTALGFDTESKPLFSVNQVDTGPHVVQLATCSHAILLQLHHAQAVELAREVLAAPGIVKAGFGLGNDRAQLPRRLGLEPRGLLDLDQVFARLGYGPSVGVRAAMALVLGQNFRKSKKTSTSNWSLRQLSESQRRYAANDAHAAALVHAALPAWEAAQPAAPVRRPRGPRPVRAEHPAGAERAPRSPRRADFL